MKWKNFFFLLCLIPSLTYALNQEKCRDIYSQVSQEWQRHNQLLEEYKNLTPNQNETALQLLNNSIACCRRAVSFCSTILNDIEGKSKSKRREPWRVQLKSVCEQDKNNLNAEINLILQLAQQIEGTLAADKAQILHQQGIEKTNQANNKDRSCPRRLNNVTEVVIVLNEVFQLYKEASMLEKEALALVSPYPSQMQNQKTLKENIKIYEDAARKYQREANSWPSSVANQKMILKEQMKTLTEDIRIFSEKGLKRSCYELQKQAIPILEQLIEGEEVETYKQELSALKISIDTFEKEADKNRLTDKSFVILEKEFQEREKKRKELFFKKEFLLNSAPFSSQFSKETLFSQVVPLDGQIRKKENEFILFTEQFYRFLVESNTPAKDVFVRVYENGQLLHIEQILLPFGNFQGWERYLKDGMSFIPETAVLSEFGVDLRISFSCNPKNQFSMIIAQKNLNPNYQVSISLDQETSLYKCTFLSPPPWQLECLRKPSFVKPSFEPKSLLHPISSHLKSRARLASLGKEEKNFSVLDQLVEDLKKDPMAIASYVYNEIELVDHPSCQENGVLRAPSIHRSPYVTYLEKRGSAWEQSQLLVYLLRKSGYQAVYARSQQSLPKDFVERMLFTKLDEDLEDVLLDYPWVMFFDGKEWISLFPWMKKIEVLEGYDLYSFMSDEYATANRWILRYLKGDEKILKHIGPDGDDTAGVLFVRFVEEELRQHGLSLIDVGIHRTQLKKQFSSWAHFPRPTVKGRTQVFSSLSNIPGISANIKIQIYSHENPQKSVSHILPLSFLNEEPSFIHFSPFENDCYRLDLAVAGRYINFLELDASDRLIDIKISFDLLGGGIYSMEKAFSVAKGTEAAICIHFGGETSKIASQFYEKFSLEKDEKKRLPILLSFLGASYFERCSRAERILADLHKIKSTVIFALGLIKLSPSNGNEMHSSSEKLVIPQVDMAWFHTELPQLSDSSIWHQELYTAHMQYQALITTDSSSNEHHILREVFKDPYAISTVKLLQIAHQEQQKKEMEGEGFLHFTAASFRVADKAPEAAKSLYFSHIEDLNLRNIRFASSGQWEILQGLFNLNNPLSRWSFAYLTPGLTSSKNFLYKEMGTLILCPYKQSALISNNNLILNGGLGSSLPSNYFTPRVIKEWELVPLTSGSINSYALQMPLQLISTSTPYPGSASIQDGTRPKELVSDIRPWYKSVWNSVADPVDVVTGAFYIDETDLMFSTPFSLSIRRNYNSQNPLMGELGCGWKLSLNPFLVDQDGKRFAAELDGTVLAYRYNEQTRRWEVFPEDNPELFNFNQQGIGSIASLFHSYIENDVLYGADGSKRFYERGLLQRWVDERGNILFFSYTNERLTRIESSHGDFCGIYYNHEGKISEIYAKDGRRILYDYNSQGDLVKITLPNTAKVSYEYDRNHRIIRETKSNGWVLENIYDEQGKVREQKSPAGPQQGLITTAIFEYTEGQTIVTDAQDAKTIYKIFDKQIYKITDPLGFITLQSWFIDKKSWFDPKTETVIEWNQEGGAIRSLKSTTDKRGLTTHYLYDARGNPNLIELQGEDLTGNGLSKIDKRLTYNNLNLCIEEELYEYRTVTSYDLTFSYLPKRIEKYVGNNLLSYIHFDYNFLGQLEKEDHSGSVILWRHNKEGLPCEKIQMTGTDDPNVVTTYDYNCQGQCIEIVSIDGIQKNEYDIMGNQIVSKVFSLSGELLSAIYIGYDSNNSPIWRQTANSENVVYLDYHASGLVKAKRQSLFPTQATAYTLYDYDQRGCLIEETDPRGYSTYIEYDALGRVQSKTKEGHTALFSYEPGGLIETITSPSGGRIKRYYTTNGLLKEEVFPDGTKNTLIYDILGRVVLETKNDVSWQIQYDDVHNCMIRTHVKTNISEISRFDAQGNLLSFTDAAGYTLEKNYDGLGRIKKEISPSGRQTFWNYQGDRIICNLPNHETVVSQYSGGRAVKSEVIDVKGNLIAKSVFCFDPENDKEEIFQGDKKTVIWKNAFGFPIKIQKGEVTSAYEYDSCGNCITSMDGDERTTHQEFDGLGRLIKRKLADGNIIEFYYDLDSNITEYHLPNGNIWKASYDLMCRKKSEELTSSKGSSNCWNFFYENGYLKEAVDPMERTHSYVYDSYGRLVQDIVERNKRTYVYDPRGFLLVADQTIERPPSSLSRCIYGPQNEHSLVERSYDADGKLAFESIYLNSKLIQETCQEWTPHGRCLQIGSHVRDFVYQNSQLVKVSTEHAEVFCGYDLDRSLIRKSSRLSSTKIDYNTAGLPSIISMNVREGTFKQQLRWDASGKLHTYTDSEREQHFSYDHRGHLKTAGAEHYEFDFGAKGTGVRTSAPNAYVLKDGLDDFGRILHSVFERTSCAYCYNPMGEVVTFGQKKLSWDSWGRLIGVTDPSFSWEASYDALGRRLQTRYGTSEQQNLVTNSFYDPEEEFQEIGVQIGEKIFWKIYGPDACEIITDEAGASVALMYNALRHLIGVSSEQGTLYSKKINTVYGPIGADYLIPIDLISYAQSLSWHSKAQDPTGLIWMGARYYDSSNGRFLSHDPVSYPLCLDLYAYANGDPVNYFDPDGRFASYAYQLTKPVLIESIDCRRTWNRNVSYLAKNGLTNSTTFQVGSIDFPNIAVGWINGIQNSKKESMKSALKLSEYAKGAKIHGIYNASNFAGTQPLSITTDVLECAISHIGFHTPPVQLLKDQWNDFFATSSPEAKFFQVCHSGGADHVKNALATSPESIQQRIIVLAIAPSVIIPRKLCYEAYNYISRRDLVTHLDLYGKMKYGEELIVLDPHPDGKFWEHDFLSPVFETVLNRHIKEYINEYGGIN